LRANPDDPRAHNHFRHHLFRRLLVGSLSYCEVNRMTFIDFNIHAVAPVPEHKARLIRDGITRNEYKQRFGLDEASERLFSRVESDRKLAERVASATKSVVKAKPPETREDLVTKQNKSLKVRVLSALRQNPEGLSSSKIAAMLEASPNVISNTLLHLCNYQLVRWEQPKKAGRFRLWFALTQKEKAFFDAPELWPSVSDIQSAVEKEFNIGPMAIVNQGRRPSVAQARFIAIVLCRDIKAMSYPDIGMRFGGRDHSTIMYAEKRGREMIASEPELAARVDRIREQFERGKK
jgi:hypothetical protein